MKMQKSTKISRAQVVSLFILGAACYYATQKSGSTQVNQAPVIED
jgi:hypothetical protein